MTKSKLEKRLLEDVVIFENNEESETGARAIAPDHHARARQTPRELPRPAALVAATLQQRVEQFLFRQSELLDGGHWRQYIDLFTSDGVYWMPASAEQTEWLDSPSIFIEDVTMMEVRMGRLMHPNAWSQAPTWGTSHIVGNVVIESATTHELTVRSRFHVVELRRDAQRIFTGTYRHDLIEEGDSFRIRLQRVDLLNAQAPFEYVIQAWL